MIENRILDEIILLLDLKTYIDNMFRIIIIDIKIILSMIFLFIFDKREMKMRNDVPNKGLEWTNLILGAGLACAAIMFVGLPAAAWDAGVVGALIVCSSAVALYRYGD